MSTYIDRDALARHLVPMVPGIIRDHYPNAKPDGNGWRLDDFSGQAGTSLSVSRNGDFYDFANCVCRGGVIDFYAKVFGLEESDHILKAVAEHSGFGRVDHSVYRASKLQLFEQYTYHNEDGSEAFHIGRFHHVAETGEAENDAETGKLRKEFRPINPDGSISRLPQGLKNKRPLYQIASIINADHVVVVEGERAADALFAKSICATTWHGGTGCMPDKVNWSPLSDKKVVLWPDNDDVGRRHMEKVAA